MKEQTTINQFFVRDFMIHYIFQFLHEKIIVIFEDNHHQIQVFQTLLILTDINSYSEFCLLNLIQLKISQKNFDHSNHHFQYSFSLKD